MATGFSIDPDQGLSEADETRLVRLAAELGYESAWTPSGADRAAFERCRRWHKASGLPVGISAVPASGQSPAFYAEQAKRLWDATAGRFTLVIGSGQAEHPVRVMRTYIPDIRARLPERLPLYLAALGPLMLRVAAELADGVALNWCTAEQVAWSRQQLNDAARAAGRPLPPVIEYVRTAVDPDPEVAAQTVSRAALRYGRIPMYRAHFERMGFAEALRRIDESGESPPTRGLMVGAAGAPGQTRKQFEKLAAGLDFPIVRVLVVNRGDAKSAQRVLEECRPVH
jgi:alkanesulfonate monooxygenase SsuD/methylene tetrahydromethanopterin reductase-like flavin-dependent oxidoreductase (luciferase family)